MCSSSSKKIPPNVAKIVLVTTHEQKNKKLGKRVWKDLWDYTYLILLVWIGDLEFFAFLDHKHSVYIVRGSDNGSRLLLSNWVIPGASWESLARWASHCGHHLFLEIRWLSAASSMALLRSGTAWVLYPISLALVLRCYYEGQNIRHAQRAASISGKRGVRLINGLLVPADELTPYMVSLVLFHTLIDSLSLIAHRKF